MNKLNFKEVLELLGAKGFDGSPEHVDMILEATEDLIDRHGKEWIKLNADRLKAEWEIVVGDRFIDKNTSD